MLRAILLTSPFVLSVIISCGDSTSEFDDSPGSAGTDASPSGASGTTSSEAGNTSAAGSSNGKAGNGGSGNGAGSSNNGGNGNGAGTSNNGGNGAGTANNGGTTPTDGGSSSAGAPPDPMAGAPGAAGDNGAAGAPTGPLCPNIFGSYETKYTTGNCEGLGKNAPQTIQGTDVACYAHFVSLVVGGGGSNGGNAGINGGVALDQDGDFSEAKLYLGKTERSPCMGNWNAAEERMTVKCGGAADACTVVLARK